MINSFTIYKEYYDLITLLSDKEQQELSLAIIKYMFEDIEPSLNDKQKKVFNNLKRPLDKSKEQSKRRTKQEPNRNQIETKQKPKEEPNKNTSKMLMSMSNVNVNVNKNNKFIKPSIEEIKEYCLERKNNIDPNNFYDFYESKGWKVGSQPMKDWKACIRTWERRNKKEEQVPEWFNQAIAVEIDEENKKELEELIKKYEN